MKYSEKYQQQLDTATFQEMSEGKRVRASFEGGWEEFPTHNNPERAIRKWKDAMLLKIEGTKIVESFEGLSIEEVTKHPKYSHSRSRSYGVVFYCFAPNSPSGVLACGGCSNEELARVEKCLSPTEMR